MSFNISMIACASAPALPACRRNHLIIAAPSYSSSSSSLLSHSTSVFKLNSASPPSLRVLCFAASDWTPAVSVNSSGDEEDLAAAGVLNNFENLCKHLEPTIFKEEIQPHTFLADVMSQIRYTATADQLLEEVDYCFLDVSGLPVIDGKSRCVGVVSKRDRIKASNGLQSTVGEVMTAPAITMSADKTVNDAAISMLKNKIHRIPVVNEANQVIGMVTRSDIFKALEGHH